MTNPKICVSPGYSVFNSGPTSYYRLWFLAELGTNNIISKAQRSFQPVKALRKISNLIFLIFEAQRNLRNELFDSVEAQRNCGAAFSHQVKAQLNLRN